MDKEATFANGFPDSLRDEYTNVISVITEGVDNLTYKIVDGYNSEHEIYVLSDGTQIKFPYRIYLQQDDVAYSKLNYDERLIYNCIFTRSDNGHIREENIRILLAKDIPEWCFPYIVRLSSDYVLEIVSEVYKGLKQHDNRLLQEFCRNNPGIMQTAYRRMYSYWNEYYRRDFPKINTYIGWRLFSECLAF
jgi:hypothetical protein